MQKPTQALKSVKGPGNAFDINPKWAKILLLGIFHGTFIEPPSLHQKKFKYQSWYLTPCCELEVQTPTQKLKSVKGPSNTFDLNSEWARPLPLNFPWDIYWSLGGSINSPWKIPNGKVLVHLGFKSNVLPGPLTDLSACSHCVGFCTSSPQQQSIAVKCHAQGHSLLYIYQRHSWNFRIYRSCTKTSIKDANTTKCNQIWAQNNPYIFTCNYHCLCHSIQYYFQNTKSERNFFL